MSYCGFWLQINPESKDENTEPPGYPVKPVFCGCTLFALAPDKFFDITVVPLMLT
jgi:hypothetical protein